MAGVGPSEAQRGKMNDGDGFWFSGPLEMRSTFFLSSTKVVTNVLILCA